MNSAVGLEHRVNYDNLMSSGTTGITLARAEISRELGQVPFLQD